MEQCHDSVQEGISKKLLLNYLSKWTMFLQAMTLYPDDGAAKVMYNRCDFIQREALQLPTAWDGTWPINQ